MYGGSKAAHDPNVYPQVMRDGKNTELPTQGRLMTPVYEVESKTKLEKSPSGSEADYTDQAGFKVKGVAGWQRTDDMSKHPFDQKML